jgi:hypothetical protein
MFPMGNLLQHGFGQVPRQGIMVLLAPGLVRRLVVVLLLFHRHPRRSGSDMACSHRCPVRRAARAVLLQAVPVHP